MKRTLIAYNRDHSSPDLQVEYVGIGFKCSGEPMLHICSKKSSYADLTILFSMPDDNDGVTMFSFQGKNPTVDILKACDFDLVSFVETSGALDGGPETIFLVALERAVQTLGKVRITRASGGVIIRLELRNHYSEIYLEKSIADQYFVRT